MLMVIKRVQGCSQSDALKWVTCALFYFFTNECTECKKCAAKKHSCTACDPVADSLCKTQRTPTQRLHAVHLTCSACLFVYLINLFRSGDSTARITLEPFQRTKHTLISSYTSWCYGNMHSGTGGHRCAYANWTRRHIIRLECIRLVRFALLVNVLIMNVALPLMHSDACIIGILASTKHSDIDEFIPFILPSTSS